MKRIILTLIFCLSIFNLPIHAQNEPANSHTEETLEGEISQILEDKVSDRYQKLEVYITKGSLKGKFIIIESGNLPISSIPSYKVDDQVVITHGKDQNNQDYYYIIDYVRRSSLLVLFIVFVIITIIIGGWQGATSLLGMILSFLVIFYFILPQIYQGNPPVIIAILGSLIIIPATFFLSHGINRKTIIAISGTLISLIITGLLTIFFVDNAKLTGFASEEASFLQSYKPGVINIKGLLIAGIIIGVLGVLDDITISQAAIVRELKQTNPKLKPPQLFHQAMKIGKDHIASMVNTLILVYTGASLPLMLIFIDNPHPFSEIINYELVADEVVRTLVGSIGLMLAVPITTLIAAHTTVKESH